MPEWEDRKTRKRNCPVEKNELIVGMWTWASLGEVQVETTSRHRAYGPSAPVDVSSEKRSSLEPDSAAHRGEWVRAPRMGRPLAV